MRSTVCRISEEVSIPLQSYSPSLPSGSNHKVERNSHSQETAVNCNREGTFMDMPPSFTSLITNCFSETRGCSTARVIFSRILFDSFLRTQFYCSNYSAAERSSTSEEMDLKSQIMVSSRTDGFCFLVYVVGQRKCCSASCLSSTRKGCSAAATIYY